MSDNDISVEINGDLIDIHDDCSLSACIHIDQWEQIKNAVDAKLSARKPNLSIRDRITTGFESAIQAQLQE